MIMPPHALLSSHTKSTPCSYILFDLQHAMEDMAKLVVSVMGVLVLEEGRMIEEDGGKQDCAWRLCKERTLIEGAYRSC